MPQWLAAASRAARRGLHGRAQMTRPVTRQVAPQQPQMTRLARAFASAPHPSETFLTGANNAYVEEMYASWKADPLRFVSAIACCFFSASGGANWY